MIRRVAGRFPILFAGGVARNPCVRALLEETLGRGLFVPPEPDLVGAWGAAVYGRKNAD
jgi:activator of 2-hydroxyglutaryl-CoA dehydratase